MISHSFNHSSISKFLSWLSVNGYYTHDPYSLWSTWYGIKAKAVYQKNRIAGAALIAPIFIADILVPRFARTRLAKHRFPIADAHCVLGFCELYKQSGDERYLQEAESVASSLIEQSLIDDYSGHCWGYPFDWMSKQGLWKCNTPLITTTPYCFEAFTTLFELTQKSEYLNVAQSIAHFAFTDLNETIINEHSVACSYSPVDNTMVVNANAYRAFVLTESWRRFGSSSMIAAAKRNLNFVLESQQPDGSWWYAMGNPSDLFVDNFHTCLVLKNLIKINRVLGFTEVWDAIARGYEYYLNNLFDASGEPRPFAKTQRVKLVSREIYDYAEGISLGLLLHKHFPSTMDNAGLRAKAMQTAQKLTSTLINDYQMEDGHFVTKEHFGFIRNTTPYIRWAQSQVFFALSLMGGVAESKEESHRYEVSHQLSD